MHYRCFLKLYKVEIALADLINQNFACTSRCASSKSHRVIQHHLIEENVLINKAVSSKQNFCLLKMLLMIIYTET